MRQQHSAGDRLFNRDVFLEPVGRLIRNRHGDPALIAQRNQILPHRFLLAKTKNWSNNMTSFRSTIRFLSSACGIFKTSAYCTTSSNEYNKQVLPNSRTEYIVDALLIPVKCLNRIGIWLLFATIAQEDYNLHLQYKNRDFSWKSSYFSAIPFAS